MKVSSSSRLSQCHLRARLSSTPLKHVHLQRVFSPLLKSSKMVGLVSRGLRQSQVAPNISFKADGFAAA